MDGGVEVLALHVLERVEVSRGWIPRFGPGDVEAHTASVAPPHRQFGDLETASSGAHGRADDVDGQARAATSAGESIDHCLHHLVESEALLGAQFGCHAYLGIDHAVGCQVDGTLVGNAFDGIAVLHDTDGVSERLEVQHEVVALGPSVEPCGEVGDVVGGESGVAEFVGEFHDGGWPQPAVEVIVQQDLWQCDDIHLGRQRRGSGG